MAAVIERNPPLAQICAEMVKLAGARNKITEAEVLVLYRDARALFRTLLRKSGYSDSQITPLLTKFNDAGPRSAPWKAASSRVPGRPQDGDDGNRTHRWKLPPDHKFYSTRVDGTLVAIKYILQALSMTGAPAVPDSISKAFTWLVGHEVRPGLFRDPVTLSEVRFEEVINDPRTITSGHVVPLDRNGRHVPDNTSLITKVGNSLQGNNTIPELLDIIEGILRRHRRIG